jgi:hypothetical protein
MTLKPITCWRLIAPLLFLLLVACNTGGESTTGSSTAGTRTAAKPQPLSLEEIADAFVRGDGKDPVVGWIAHEIPRAEVHSFLEYGSGQRRGHVYRWGNNMNLEAGLCAVYMLWDYTPVQLSLNLAWYSKVSRISPEALRAQCLELMKELEDIESSSTQEIRPRDGWQVAHGDGVDFQFYDTGEDTPGTAMFELSLTPEQAALVMERNARFTELREFASVDTPATLDELVSLMSTQGARGILDQYDFSTFKQMSWHEPLDRSEIRGYSQATSYMAGGFIWNTTYLAYLSAFDDGRRTQFMFTPSWYAKRNGISTAALDLEFDNLLAANGGKRVVFDADNDAYDVAFAYCYVNRVNVVRRQYLKAANPAEQVLYTLYADNELFPDAPDGLTQGQALLPPAGERANELELLLREMASLPTAELRKLHIVGFQRDERNIPPHKTGPFSTRQFFDYIAPVTRHRLATITLLNDTYVESYKFTPAWLGSQLDMDWQDVDQQFIEFAAAYSAQDGTFSFGEITISREAGEHPDGVDTWYTCEFPTWP